MADIILSPVVNSAVNKIRSLVLSKQSTARGIKDPERLLTIMEIILEVIMDAESRQTKEDVRVWLEKLQEVVTVLNDLLDAVSTGDPGRREENIHEKIQKKVYSFWSTLVSTSLNSKVTDVLAKLEDTIDEIERLGFVKKVYKDAHGVGKIFKTHRVLIGRDSVKEKIIDKLIVKKKTSDALPIVGDVGLGKTTLAKSVFGDDKIKEHFDLLLWANVSLDRFSLRKFVARILGRKDTDESLETLQKELRHKLKEKRFLLVLDDVRSMNLLQLDELQELLKNDKEGNKILATTRSDEVACRMDKSSKLEGLSDDDSWYIFSEWAGFSQEKQEEHPNLVQIGKKLVKGCKGVPLALAILGGILNHSVEETTWMRVKGNEIWQRTHFDVKSFLQLSFDELSQALKVFFAYCGVVCLTSNPPDKERAIQMWTAQVNTRSISPKKLEDIANGYFEELASRFLIKEVEEDDLCQVTRFEVHDCIIPDLPRLISSVHPNTKVSASNMEYVSCKTNQISESSPRRVSSKSLLNSKKLGRFLLLREQQTSGKWFSTFKRLRVLDLCLSQFEVLPSSISNLKHLRYLDLSRNEKITHIPPSIGKLQDLETLRTDGCKNLTELPPQIWELTKLKNLYATSQEATLPENFQAPLQTLRLDSFKKLKALPKAKSEGCLETLGILYCPELCLSVDDIMSKPGLRNVTIVGLLELKEIPEWLQLSASSLESLYIAECPDLKILPDWIRSLTNLKRLTIRDCWGCKSSLTDRLPRPDGLKFLRIHQCPELIKIYVSERGEACGIISEPAISSDLPSSSPDTVGDVMKDNRSKRKISDVGPSKLPPSSSGPLEEMYDETLSPSGSRPYSQSSTLFTSSSKDVTMIDAEVQAPRMVVKEKDKPGIVGFTSNSDFIEFESRRSTMGQILRALRDKNCDIVGIVGMGGVGKTAIVDEIARKAPELNFGRVVKVVVSQTVDVKRIQDEIASVLNLRFHPEESDKPSRADQLIHRLSDESERILVILDEVWSSKDSTTGKGLLEAVGVPRVVEHKGCKIILTTRREAVCDDMGIREEYKAKVGVLTDVESRVLLRKYEEDAFDSSFFPIRMAWEIVNECYGLPIALAKAGAALRGEGVDFWMAAQAVYSCLKLSYDYIKEKETKFCFLLCCLFPQGRIIDTEFIARYATGIGLFGDTITTMSQVRAHVHAAIEELTASSLLLPYWSHGENRDLTMHGLVWKFATSVASEGADKFFIKAGANLNEWPKIDSVDQITYVSLMENQIQKLPEKLECPRLELLSLLGNTGLKDIPDSCFKRTKMLRVLDLSERYFDSLLYVSRISSFKLPKSLECLENLRTLLLDGCQLEGGLPTIIGNLSKLEILSLQDSDIRELPVEIGRLSRLRLLDLEDCKQLESIPGNVISGLCNLEELYTKGGFRNWEVIRGGTAAAEEEDDARKRYASLSEIQSLSLLSVFSAGAKNLDCLPDDFSFSGKCTKFDLQVGETNSCQYGNIRQGPSFNYFSFSYECHISELISLLPSVDYLNLESVEVTAVLSDSDGEGCGGFNALKSLGLNSCNGLEYLCGSTNVAFANLEELRLEGLRSLKGFGEGVPAPGSFQNLRLLKLEECHGLGVVIPCNWVRNLPKLEKLRVYFCPSVTEIIEVKGAADEPEMTPPILPNLKELQLWSLDGLVTFCKGRPGKVISFSNLIKLDIYNCPKLASIFSPYMSRTLLHLQKLTIRGCNNLRVIFEEAEDGASMDEIQPLVFPKLKEVSVRNCEQLRSLFPVPIARGLVILQELRITDCRNLVEVVTRGDSGSGTRREANNSKEIELPWLKKMELQDLYSLKSFCGPTGYYLGLPALEELDLTECPNLAYLTSYTAAYYGLTKIPASARVLYRRLVWQDEILSEEEGEAESIEQKNRAEGKGETKQWGKEKAEEMEDPHIDDKDEMIKLLSEKLLSPTPGNVGGRFRNFRKMKIRQKFQQLQIRLLLTGRRNQ